MPIYEYRCTRCEHEFEVWQKMSDAPVKVCPSCHARRVEKLISVTSFQLKGTGWYATDYAGAKSGPPPGKSSSGDGDSGSGSSGSDSRASGGDADSGEHKGSGGDQGSGADQGRSGEKGGGADQAGGSKPDSGAKARRSHGVAAAAA